jgi:DNA-binding transcriptional MerR regulator
MALIEYRLVDLARISGVSSRNIRAYRERGLLDPPRRAGRSAYYDDYHLAQLQAINRLLSRGFTSAHIAEFFESLRVGRSLAEFLGLQQMVLQPRPESAGAGGSDIDPRSAEAVRLIELGLARRVGATLVFDNAAVGAIVARAPEPLRYLRFILALLDGVATSLEALADDVTAVLERAFTQRYGSEVRAPGDVGAISRMVSDYRELSRAVLTDRVDEALT